MNHLVGLAGECGRRDRRLGCGERRLARHAQDHGGRLLGGLRRQLEVGGHQRVAGGVHRRLDGWGDPNNGGLRGHAVVE